MTNNQDLLSDKYARFITELAYETLPQAVRHEAKNRLLDLIGVGIAGSQCDFPRMLIDYAVDMGGKEEATIIARPGKYPAPLAALANGVCGHALDMDDGHRFAAFHPASFIVPAALAAAEQIGATTEDLLVGIVAGYEVSIRLARAINPSHLKRGFHTTGTVGAFGAAATAAKIMKLNREQTSSALGIAGLQGAGLLEIISDGSGVKPINPGKASMSGVLSANLAKRGAQGPRTIFEGADGFFHAMTDSVDEPLLLAGLGEVFEITNSYTKFYACCRHTHAAIDAAAAICEESNVAPQDIESIVVETYAVATHIVGRISNPSTPEAAKFSMAYTIALQLLCGDVSANRFSNSNIADHTMQSLASKVSVVSSQRWEDAYPNIRGATVRITLKNGRTLEKSVDFPKGEPENPPSQADYHAKFMSNASIVLSQSDSARLADVLMNVENCSLEQLSSLIGCQKSRTVASPR